MYFYSIRYRYLYRYLYLPLSVPLTCTYMNTDRWDWTHVCFEDHLRFPLGSGVVFLMSDSDGRSIFPPSVMHSDAKFIGESGFVC